MGKHQPVPQPVPESLGSKLICAILGVKSEERRHNEAVAAAQQALKSGQQVILSDPKTNKVYKQMVARAGGKNLPVATAPDGVTTYVDVPGKNGGTDHHTIVHGEIVATWHTG